jgi:tetratricopeptide (TPR) repeat protein
MMHSSDRSRFLGVCLFIFLCILATVAMQTRATPRAESVVLEVGKTIEGQLAGGQTHEFQFSVQSGQYVRISIEQRSIDVAIACFGPDVKELFGANSSEIGDTETAELIGDASGIYRLRLTPSDPTAPSGLYEITLRNIEPATEHHNARIAARRAFAQAVALYRQGTRESLLKAILSLEDALIQWRAARDLFEEARTLYTVGRTYIEIGDQQQALKYASEALSVALRYSPFFGQKN